MSEINSHASSSVGASPGECAPYGAGWGNSQAVDASMRANLGIARAAATAKTQDLFAA